MQGYDLDGTLARVNFAQAAVKSIESIIADAPVIYVPREPFVIITGRPHRTDAQKRATATWLRENQPNFKAIHYVDGSETQMIEQKIATIKRLNLTSFTDNNPDVLKGIREQLPTLDLYRMTADGKRNPY